MSDTKPTDRDTPESIPALDSGRANTWSFPKEFWLANLMELFERAAYYGFFIALTLYLTQVVGFSDKETGIVAGLFYGGLYLLPPFVGAISDRIGFKRGLMLAFGLLTTGYFFLGVFYSKGAVIFFLFLAMVGGSFIKPLITGTVAKTTSLENRARAYSLFYWVVNVGAFAGKTVVPELIQRDATAERIAAEAASVLDDPARAAAVRAELLTVRRSLGEPGAADRAALAVLTGAAKKAGSS